MPRPRIWPYSLHTVDATDSWKNSKVDATTFEILKLKFTKFHFRPEPAEVLTALPQTS